MINPAVLIGEPLYFKEGITVYPPKIKDVVSNPLYGAFLRTLTITEEDIRDEIRKKNPEAKTFPTPYEFLFVNSYHSKEFLKIVKEAFQFFIHKDISFLFEEKMIIIGNLEQVVQEIPSIKDLIVLKEEEYFSFQNLIRLAIGEKPKKPPEPEDPNEDPRIARIKAKARERDRIKAKKGAAGGISTETCLVAICCMGIGLTPLNIGEMSYAAVGELMTMMQNKEKYDVDIRSLLAGADSKKVKPKYWIRNSD